MKILQVDISRATLCTPNVSLPDCCNEENSHSLAGARELCLLCVGRAKPSARLLQLSSGKRSFLGSTCLGVKSVGARHEVCEGEKCPSVNAEEDPRKKSAAGSWPATSENDQGSDCLTEELTVW